MSETRFDALRTSYTLLVRRLTFQPSTTPQVLLGANFLALQESSFLHGSMTTLYFFVLYFLADVCWIALRPASVPPEGGLRDFPRRGLGGGEGFLLSYH